MNGPNVDAHVEDRKGRVTICAPHFALMVGRVVAQLRIEVADHRADVRLEQPGADDDEEQAEEERPHVGRTDERRGQREVAYRDDHAPAEDSFSLSPKVVGHPPAGQCEQVHHRRVQPEKGPRHGIAESQTGISPVHRGDHEQDQERTHSVVGEALPHLGEEQGGQPSRLPEEHLSARRLIPGWRVVGSRTQNRSRSVVCFGWNALYVGVLLVPGKYE